MQPYEHLLWDVAAIVVLIDTAWFVRRWLWRAGRNARNALETRRYLRRDARRRHRALIATAPHRNDPEDGGWLP